MSPSVQALLALTLLLTGCASAGGTRNIFSLGSAWYKHPTTGDVKECGGGFYPGVQIRRFGCGQAYLEQGYVEVENCGDASGALCITEAEKRVAEAAERGQQRLWVLWEREETEWSPRAGYDSRSACEAKRVSASLLCLPDTVDPRGPKEK